MHRTLRKTTSRLLGLVLFLTVPTTVRATPGTAQVFSVLDRKVVTVGEVFVLRVEAYVTSGTAEEGARFEQAFREGRFAGPLSDVMLVRDEMLPLRFRTTGAGAAVLVMTRRFELRARHTGSLTVPSFEVRAGGQVFATAPRVMHAYRVTPAFFAAREAVVPVVTEARDPAAGRAILRTGSAFLVASDAFLTGYHVIMDARRVWLTLPDGRRLRIKKAWAVDPVRDVAVLYVDPGAVRRAGLVPLRLAPVDDMVPATDPVDYPATDPVVFTYGWPRGIQRSTAAARYRGMTFDRRERLWVSANPVRPGDSGGPLLTAAGTVLGVVSLGTAIESRPDVLREEVCMATDPRPALQAMRLAKKPRALALFFKDTQFARQPHVQAFRLAALLSLGRRHLPGLADWLADFDAAVEAWDRPDPALHFKRGLIYQMLGAPVDATAAYRAALDVYEGYFPALYMLALQALEHRDFTMAGRLFARTQTYAPYAHLATYGRARAAMGRLHYDAAIPLLHAVLHYDATFAPALYDLALCHLARGREAPARQLLARLEDSHPEWARRLRRIFRSPALRPVAPRPLPLAPLPVFP